MIKNKISRFFRQIAAYVTVLASKETGGMLFDYANGQWEQLHAWKDQETREQLDRLGANLITHMRDNIYVALVNCNGPHGVCGSIQVIYPVQEPVEGVLCTTHTNKPRLWERFFCDLYPFEEAFKDTAVKCVDLAQKLGYRVPEEV